jgi:hypothetical protein
MPYPQVMSLPRPCPKCGGKLQRKTVNPNKPLGLVACLNCQYKSSIVVYIKNVRTELMAKAKARKAQG